MKRSWLALTVLLVGFVLTGASCGSGTAVPKSFTLNYWTVQTNQDDIAAVVTAFQAKYPYIDLRVRRFTLEEYETKLIEAWSHNEGPDIFSIPNTRLGKFKTYIAPLPSSLTLTTVTETSSFAKKQTVVTKETKPAVSPQKLASLFPQVVYTDVVLDEKIYGLPLSLDTLVLYYNKDLLSRASIALPANTWDDFNNQVKAPKLTLIDINNNVIQSGTSLGTCNNIPLCFDIISLLMMQNGADMTNGNKVNFAGASPDNKEEFPGIRAVDFYTSFANPKAAWYSWNADQPDAQEAFTAGHTAYYFGYFYQLEQIQKQAPNLNFDVAPVPQINQTAPINYANYWLESVSNNSAHTNEAWAFLQTLTTDDTAAKAYSDKAKKPAALNTLLQKQQDDFTLGIFANEILSAKSWYAGLNQPQANLIFKEMITQIHDGTSDTATAVKNAAAKISLTYQVDEN